MFAYRVLKKDSRFPSIYSLILQLYLLNDFIHGLETTLVEKHTQEIITTMDYTTRDNKNTNLKYLRQIYNNY